MSFWFPFNGGFKIGKLYKKKTKCNQDVISVFLLERMMSDGFLSNLSSLAGRNVWWLLSSAAGLNRKTALLAKSAVCFLRVLQLSLCRLNCG
ncbi:hypothetical protein [Actinobacillus porcinus]|uniref:hypothetical protein n=1 Tax=Actinobacillus porcinus TaxID=51048 RepID=UPI002355BF77|nr:hypothetical protein [Actinobacillus porcinus]